MKHVLKMIYWRTRIIWLALQWLPQYNLGDYVWYRGERWILSQGRSAPSWTVRKDQVSIDTHERNFSKVHSPSNWWHSLRSGYRFYMNNWYAIWMREGVQPWMAGLHIWPKNNKRWSASDE